jgi:phosphoenolpyruvate phosphomutase
MTGSSRLRALLSSKGPLVLAGAHNGLSARLAAQAGYEGIWASGFEISASFAVPDANIVTLADNLHVLRQMVLATDAPIVADCDEGYGNAINVTHMVRQYEQAGAAGICIEDNISPKRCSFYAGVKRELATAEEHAGKVRAAKATQRSSDFVVIARTEALIAGWGLEEALRRGRAYADAGADLVLIHSKSSDPAEVFAFAKAWDRKVPLVCVPTTYTGVSVQALHEQGFKLVIHANHGLRSAIKAMKETFRTLRREGTTESVGKLVVPLEEVYEAVGVETMKADEKKYLPADAAGTSAVILAAGFEKSLLPLIAEKPRAMLDIRGRTILERQIDVLNRCSIKDVSVVRGYKKEQIVVAGIRTFDNDEYEKTSEAVSLFAASSVLKGRVVLVYGDVLFDPQIVERLLRSPANLAIAVDRSIAALPPEQRNGRVRDFVVDDAPGVEGPHDRFLAGSRPGRVTRVGTTIPKAEAKGEFIGLVMLTEQGCRMIKDAWNRALERGRNARFHEAPSLAEATVTDLLQEVIAQGGEVSAVDVFKGWMEIDTFEDYQRAWASLR